MPDFTILVPIIALLIPIVAILTKHQTRMAQIIHRQGNNNNNNSANDTSELREEVRQLRELMHQQTIALDNLRDAVRASNSVQARITDGL